MSSLKFVEHKRIVGDEWNALPTVEEGPHTKEWTAPVRKGVVIPFAMDWLEKGKHLPPLKR